MNNSLDPCGKLSCVLKDQKIDRENVAIELSYDHKPTRPDEKERIEGEVKIMKKEIFDLI